MGDRDLRCLSVRVVPSIAAFDRDEWDACAGDNPFVRHAYLAALEDSGSAAPATGWRAQHLAVFEDGRLQAAMPLYQKAHSLGEYVFDHAWAQAYAHAGGRYYPKLLAAVPFTPVAGPRLLVRPGLPFEPYAQALAHAARDLVKAQGASSVHINFLSEAEWRLLGQIGYLQRLDYQFHWQNQGYESFETFLGHLSSRKRKAIRRERAAVAASGVRIETLRGREITVDHWDAFFRFYLDTGSRKWGQPYLNREFFRLIAERLGDALVLILAKRERYIGGALHVLGKDTLYGRYWGAIERQPFLHFECCYYRAIDLAIALRLERIEAGAQGEHKIVRGYAPKPTYSAHWIENPAFRRAIARSLDRERPAIAAEIADLEASLPFRQGAFQDPG